MLRIATIWVLVEDWTVAPIPPVTLTVGLLPNPEPVIVTVVLAPAGPFAGAILAITGLKLSGPALLSAGSPVQQPSKLIPSAPCANTYMLSGTLAVAVGVI